MNTLIEATTKFEKDLKRLSEYEQSLVIKEIKHCTELFKTRKAHLYRTKLSPAPHLLNLNGYQSSLHTLKIADKIRIILSVDEDPIFGQVIFTLHRATKQHELNNAYKNIAQALYQELIHHPQQTA
ncbi:hypothetical protein KFZ76_14635 [Methylovulum psychrotolerans]|uniref:type II toxin-antitoxin system RelE family toxin n=1 Tax=Methylovulum psychrotolerans TaxID=1704499 RepID=UPI001BFF9CA9|nr:hypothetical protein [Methylovulum psychrotolerans]MBT9098940.1 hypothetical protein [Methylovulum psychrotolerans]